MGRFLENDMTPKTIRLAAQQIASVAENQATRNNHKVAAELKRIASALNAEAHARRVAQFLGNEPTYGAGGMDANSTAAGDGPTVTMGFDPSQEMGIQDFKNGQGSGGGGGGLHPSIETFVKPHGNSLTGGGQGEGTLHTCTVTFRDHNSVGEPKMMNYILGIGENLGVDVEKFAWSKQTPKPAMA